LLLNPALRKDFSVVRQCKKTAHTQMAHLVFADSRANAQKTKSAYIFASARTDEPTLKSKFDD